MKTIGAFSAKTHLSELLEQVSRGESFVITKRGKPMAALSPVNVPRKQGPKASLPRIPQEICEIVEEVLCARDQRADRVRKTMKGIVVDASVAASWLLDDELSEVAEWVLDQMEAGVAVSVPSLWLLEIANGLFKAERQKRINREHRNAALERIEGWPLKIHAAPTMADLKTLRHYAEKHQLTCYDAEYLRVAKEHNLMLATLDGNLLAAAKREKVQVVTPT